MCQVIGCLAFKLYASDYTWIFSVRRPFRFADEISLLYFNCVPTCPYSVYRVSVSVRPASQLDFIRFITLHCSLFANAIILTKINLLLHNLIKWPWSMLRYICCSWAARKQSTEPWVNNSEMRTNNCEPRVNNGVNWRSRYFRLDRERKCPISRRLCLIRKWSFHVAWILTFE